MSIHHFRSTYASRNGSPLKKTSELSLQGTALVYISSTISSTLGCSNGAYMGVKIGKQDLEKPLT